MNECVLSDRHRVPLLYILVVYEYSIDDVTIGHRPKDANPPWLRACVPTRLFSPRLFSSTVNLGAYPVSHVRGGRSSTVNPADGDLYNNGAIPCLILYTPMGYIRAPLRLLPPVHLSVPPVHQQRGSCITISCDFLYEQKDSSAAGACGPGREQALEGGGNWEGWMRVCVGTPFRVCTFSVSEYMSASNTLPGGLRGVYQPSIWQLAVEVSQWQFIPFGQLVWQLVLSKQRACTLCVHRWSSRGGDPWDQ